MIFTGSVETGFVHVVNCKKCVAYDDCKVRKQYEDYIKNAIDQYDENRPRFVNVDITCRAYFPREFKRDKW